MLTLQKLVQRMLDRKAQNLRAAAEVKLREAQVQLACDLYREALKIERKEEG